MIETARKLIDLYGDQLALVVNMSGGKDSVRLLGFLKEEFPNQPMYVVHADTGFEHIKPISAEDFARARTESFGEKLYVVKAEWGTHEGRGEFRRPYPPELVGTRKTYLQMVERRGMFPSMGERNCTSDLKRGPIARFINTFKDRYQVVLNCSGIRAGESTKRAKQNPWKVNEKLTTRATKVFDWMPIFRETLKDVIHWHWKIGMPLHPVYVPEYHFDGTQGGYLRRLSCRVCIFSTPADIKAIYEHDREAFDLVADLEKRINFTMRNRESLVQIVERPLTPKEMQQYGSEEPFKEEAQTPCLF